MPKEEAGGSSSWNRKPVLHLSNLARVRIYIYLSLSVCVCVCVSIGAVDTAYRFKDNLLCRVFHSSTHSLSLSSVAVNFQSKDAKCVIYLFTRVIIMDET